MPIFLIRYFRWHFGDETREILRGWKNFLAFGLNFFSITLLLKTLFSPWRRISWTGGRGFDLGEQFLVLFSNLFSRFLGAIMRSALILVGFLFEIFVVFAGLIIFLAWLILPFLSLGGLYLGLIVLF